MIRRANEKSWTWTKLLRDDVEPTPRPAGPPLQLPSLRELELRLRAPVGLLIARRTAPGDLGDNVLSARRRTAGAGNQTSGPV